VEQEALVIRRWRRRRGGGTGTGGGLGGAGSGSGSVLVLTTCSPINVRVQRESVHLGQLGRIRCIKIIKRPLVAKRDLNFKPARESNEMPRFECAGVGRIVDSSLIDDPCRTS